MKKIQFIVLHLGHGGVQKSVVNQANMFVDEYNVEIISFYKLSDEAKYQLDDRVKVIYLSDLEPNKKAFLKAVKTFNPVSLVQEGFLSLKILYLRKSLMSKFVKNSNADVLVSTRILYNSIVGDAPNHIVKIAEEHREHSNDEKYIKKFARSLKNIDYLLPVSVRMTNYYTSLLSGTKTKVVYMPNSFEPLKTKVFDYSNKKMIAVGRLEKVKAFDELIRITTEVIESNSEASLTIIGDGSERDYLNSLIQDLGMNKKIQLYGYKDENEIAQLLADSSIFLMTSIEESFGIALLEAMSVGLPSVVYSSANGFVEILQCNNGGIIIENRDRNEFVKTLNNLLPDKNRKETMGESSITRSQDFSNNAIRDKFKNFMKGVLN